MTQIEANLLVARNKMTSLEGSSRKLSTLEDRKKFHALRKDAGAIAIGGSTYRTEPYSSCPLPLFVATTRKGLHQSGVRFLNLPPVKLVELAREEIDGNLLIEGGVNFLHELIKSEVIDLIHISRVDRDGDAFEFDENLLRIHYRLVLSEQNGETQFESWEPLRKP